LSQPFFTPPPDYAPAEAMRRLQQQAEQLVGRPVTDYGDLHTWSVQQREQFWPLLADFCGLQFVHRGEQVFDAADLWRSRWFADSTLNYAANLLYPRGINKDAPAVICRDESGGRETLTYGELRQRVMTLATAMREAGVQPGDRVAACLPNRIEALVAMLASASVGAVWSSCSPDFGEAALLDRFGQAEPVLLFVCHSYRYAGRHYDVAEKMQAVVSALPTVKQVVVTGESSESDWHSWGGFVAAEPAEVFEELDFNHPLFIMFSSGTTGKPKCIEHGAGGTLLQHLKEHQLHAGLKAGDRLFFYTTTGWMMWNWLASALASGCTVVLYDGSPVWSGGAEAPEALWRMAAEERINVFGTSPQYLESLRKRNFSAQAFDLSALQSVLSTGAPLSAELFDYVAEHIKADIPVYSISGGTDIIGCFVTGNPAAAVHRGEIQCAALGMDVDVADGELICNSPFPTMPLRFLNDADGSRLTAAYFSETPGVWTHGDHCEKTAAGGFRILGRSDAVLNVSGVRIGTAEIYRPLTALPEVNDAVAVKQIDPEQIVLFVVAENRSGELAGRIRKQIREQASPRHVPSVIHFVSAVPRTMNGKLAELAAANTLNGLPVTNREALLNPECLTEFNPGSANPG